MSTTTRINDPVEMTGHPRRWLILGILCLCLVLVVASVSSLNVAIPSIQRFMTTTPHLAGPDETVASAHGLMQERGFRHLPVVRDGALLGVVAESDLRTVESLEGVDPEEILLADVMQLAPYRVRPEAPLDEVVLEMAEHRYGSAIVVDNEKVVGIFTAIDGLRALGELLHGRLGAHAR